MNRRWLRELHGSPSAQAAQHEREPDVSPASGKNSNMQVELGKKPNESGKEPVVLLHPPRVGRHVQKESNDKFILSLQSNYW